MANYNFNAQGYALAYEAPGFAVLTQRVDIPALIANQALGQPLVDDNGGVITLPATGFAATDLLRVFKIPAGTLITQGGINVVTAEGATSTCDFGDGTQAAGWLDDVDLNSVGSEITQVGDAYGSDNVTGVLYTANDSLDILFNTADTNAAVFDIWALAHKVY